MSDLNPEIRVAKVTITQKDFDNLCDEYSDLFEEKELREMKCEPFKIHLKENAKPFAVSVARNVSQPLRKPVKKELKWMEKMGIISRFDGPSPYCSPMVPIWKKENGEVRICIDFKKLNENIERQYHHSDTPFETVSTLPREELGYFAKFDARSGYWQVQLAAESRPHGVYDT